MLQLTLPSGLQSQLLTGVDEQAAASVAEAFIAEKASADTVIVLLDRNLKSLETWTEDILFFQKTLNRSAPQPAAYLLPPLPESGDAEGVRHFEVSCDRLQSITALSQKLVRIQSGETSGGPLILATTPQALLQPCPPPDSITQQKVLLKTGTVCDFQALVEQLENALAYDNEVVCETPGQFAVRGGLIDIYPVNGTSPCRIDFFGDEIESIRHFDPTSQRSEKALDSLTILPVPAQLVSTEEAYAAHYLPADVIWILREPEVLKDDFHGLFHYPENIPAPRANFSNILKLREEHGDRWVGLTALDGTDALFSTKTTTAHYETESLEGYRSYVQGNGLGHARFESEQQARSNFLSQLLHWQRSGYKIFFVARNVSEQNRLKEILEEDPTLREIKADYCEGPLSEGFRLKFSEACPPWPGCEGKAGAVLATESEVYGRNRVRISSAKRRKLPERSSVDQLLDFSELADGDHLVHLQHGICLFRGLQTLDLDGKSEEVISIEFDDNVTLHLKLHDSHLLTRYVGLSKMNPKLGRLGTNQWDKTRSNAEKATLDYAAELLSLQAKRQTDEGFAFPPDQHWQRDFEGAFPYSETPDQLTCIQDAKTDMEKPVAMDRLVCGDVGFGKTEVALRAAFKAAISGKQTAVLIPTTVLAQQHYTTFKERMAEYPIVVEMLSRFRTPTQRKQIAAQLKLGKIDIIVGTHSILSKEVKFKDLGLLIIDEEHRFGVRHKEMLKGIKANVDVITMSATPIPRTLYSALVGVRDLSVIETPPRDRLPIQTVVKSYETKIVKEAIEFETNRGGQVFYLHNRVQTIDTVAARIQEFFPKLKIGVGHGQMTEGALEKVMTRYVAGEYDVLVCTTIIESGLDIPNCNTIIIEGADRFGLAQLYQLRGRVGRFNRQAYAYLLLHRHTKLLDLARKRLSAIRQYNQLGAGIRIAMRDLELRGAGNLLGAKQSGHIAGVGFDLYCQLLRQSIARLKGDKEAIQVRAQVHLDFVVVGQQQEAAPQGVAIGYQALKEAERKKERSVQTLEAFIPDHYVNEARLRIDFYRQLALAGKLTEVKEVAQAMEDRFGKYPAEVKTLLELAEIRCLAEQRGIVSVETEGERLKCRRGNSRNGDFLKVGNRFPRLTAKKPLPRFSEIKKFIKKHPPL